MRTVTHPHTITIGHTIAIGRTHAPPHSPAHTTTHTAGCASLCRVERRTIHTLRRIPAPTSLAGEGQHLGRSRWYIVKRRTHIGRTRRRRLAQEERGGTREADVVETEVPDGGKGHAESDDGCAGTDYSTGENVVPVVEFIDGKSASDQASTEDGRKEQDHLPERGTVCAHNLELGIEVQRQEDQSRKSCSRMTRRHRLERVVDLFLVACADAPVVHDHFETVAVLRARGWDVGFADCEEVGAETTNEPFNEYLEDGGSDQ